ncbi:MAG: bacteriohemerythrin [Dissulfurispiraceae bacterium]|jgi:hemerythrin
MQLVEWKGEMSVNVKEFDAHHKKLIALANKLHDAIVEKRGSAVIGDILAVVSNYTMYHFFAEEELMDKYEYPETIRHREEHIKLTEKTLQLVEDFRNDKDGIEKEVLDFLREWINHHIFGTDKKYGPFFNSKGIV